MKIAPFKMESWLSGYRFKVAYNLAESGMRDVTLQRLLDDCGTDLRILSDLLLEDMPTNGSGYLREAIAACYADLDPERILVTTGTGEALFVLFNTLLNAGDEVVTSFPAFQALYEVPRAIGAHLVFYEHRPQENFRFDAERFCSLIGEKTRLVIVNNPHNPTGAECDDATMAAIVEKARRVGARVLFDEHYRFLPHDDRDIIPSGIRFGDDILATGSITKCFGAMGLRIGWLIGEPELLARCRDMRDYLTHTLSPLSEAIAARALRNRQVTLSENRRILRENKAALGAFMDEAGELFAYTPARAGVVCFPRYGLDMDSQSLVRELIERCGVFCLPGHSFETEGFIRIGLGPEPERFAEALSLLGPALRDLARSRGLRKER